MLEQKSNQTIYEQGLLSYYEPARTLSLINTTKKREILTNALGPKIKHNDDEITESSLEEEKVPRKRRGSDMRRLSLEEILLKKEEEEDPNEFKRRITYQGNKNDELTLLSNWITLVKSSITKVNDFFIKMLSETAHELDELKSELTKKIVNPSLLTPYSKNHQISKEC